MARLRGIGSASPFDDRITAYYSGFTAQPMHYDRVPPRTWWTASQYRHSCCTQRTILSFGFFQNPQKFLQNSNITFEKPRMRHCSFLSITNSATEPLGGNPDTGFLRKFMQARSFQDKATLVRSNEARLGFHTISANAVVCKIDWRHRSVGSSPPAPPLSLSRYFVRPTTSTTSPMSSIRAQLRKWMTSASKLNRRATRRSRW
jgi:hypothetical protein